VPRTIEILSGGTAVRHPLLLLVCVLACASWSAEAPTPPKKLSDADIEALVQQLGSDEYQKRQEAERLLGEQGEAARPALEKSASSKDPEVKQRTNNLLKAINMGRDLQNLTPERREIADLKLKSLNAPVPGEDEAWVFIYGKNGNTIIDLDRTRIVIEGVPQEGEMSMNVETGGNGSSNGSSNKFNYEYNNGLTKFDLGNAKWTLSGGDTFKIGDLEFHTSGDKRHVVFLDKTGKLISHVELPLEAKSAAKK
jgi:hypothetical protein